MGWKKIMNHHCEYHSEHFSSYSWRISSLSYFPFVCPRSSKIDKLKLKAIKVFYRSSLCMVFSRSEPTQLRTSSARPPDRSPSPPTPTTQPPWWGSPSTSSSSPSSWSGSSTATTAPSSSSARLSPASHTGMTFSSSVSGRQGELPPVLKDAGFQDEMSKGVTSARKKLTSSWAFR